MWVVLFFILSYILESSLLICFGTLLSIFLIISKWVLFIEEYDIRKINHLLIRFTYPWNSSKNRFIFSSLKFSICFINSLFRFALPTSSFNLVSYRIYRLSAPTLSSLIHLFYLDCMCCLVNCYFIFWQYRGVMCIIFFVFHF